MKLIFSSQKTTKKQTLLFQAAKLKNLFVFFSMSKFFCIGGLRIGIGIGNKEIVSFLLKGKGLFTTSKINQKIIPLLFKDHKWIKKTRRYIKEERKRVVYELSKIKEIKVLKSEANFILVKCLKNKNLEEELLKKGIKVRGGSVFKGLGNRWIRISIKDTRSNNRIIRSLKEILQN